MVATLLHFSFSSIFNSIHFKLDCVCTHLSSCVKCRQTLINRLSNYQQYSSLISLWPHSPLPYHTIQSLQQSSVVLVHHRVPKVKSILFRIDPHRQLVCYVQVGDVHAISSTTAVRVAALIPCHWRPQHSNVIVVAGTYRGISAGQGSKEKCQHRCTWNGHRQSQ